MKQKLPLFRSVLFKGTLFAALFGFAVSLLLSWAHPSPWGGADASIFNYVDYNGTRYYEVNSATETAEQVCGQLTPPAVPDHWASSATQADVCRQMTKAGIVNSLRGDKGIAYCTGNEREECANHAGKCLRCTNCRNTTAFNQTTDLYGKMFIACRQKAPQLNPQTIRSQPGQLSLSASPTTVQFCQRRDGSGKVDIRLEVGASSFTSPRQILRDTVLPGWRTQGISATTYASNVEQGSSTPQHIAYGTKPHWAGWEFSSAQRRNRTITYTWDTKKRGPLAQYQGPLQIYLQVNGRTVANPWFYLDNVGTGAGCLQGSTTPPTAPPTHSAASAGFPQLINDGGKYYAEVTDTRNNSTGHEACANHGLKCVGPPAAGDYGPCLAQHPHAEKVSQIHGGKDVSYCAPNTNKTDLSCKGRTKETCTVCQNCTVKNFCNASLRNSQYADSWFVECSAPGGAGPIANPSSTAGSANPTQPSSISQQGAFIQRDNSGDMVYQITIANANSQTDLQVQYAPVVTAQSTSAPAYYKAAIADVRDSTGKSYPFDNGKTFQISGLPTQLGPVTLTIAWDARAPLPANGKGPIKGDGFALVKITPRSANQVGNPVISQAFQVDNQAPTGFSKMSSSLVTEISANVGWSPTAKDRNFLHYDIWYGTDRAQVVAQNPNTASNKVVTGQQSVATTLVGLKPGTTYWATIWAVDRYGNRQQGSVISFQTKSSATATSGSSSGGAISLNFGPRPLVQTYQGLIQGSFEVSHSGKRPTKAQMEFSTDGFQTSRMASLAIAGTDPGSLKTKDVYHPRVSSRASYPMGPMLTDQYSKVTYNFVWDAFLGLPRGTDKISRDVQLRIMVTDNAGHSPVMFVSPVFTIVPKAQATATNTVLLLTASGRQPSQGSGASSGASGSGATSGSGQAGNTGGSSSSATGSGSGSSSAGAPAPGTRGSAPTGGGSTGATSPSSSSSGSTASRVSGDVYDGSWTSNQFSSGGSFQFTVDPTGNPADFRIQASGGLFVPQIDISGTAQIASTTISVPNSVQGSNLAANIDMARQNFVITGDFPTMPFIFVMRGTISSDRKTLDGSAFTFPRGTGPFMTEADCRDERVAGRTCDQNDFSGILTSGPGSGTPGNTSSSGSGSAGLAPGTGVFGGAPTPPVQIIAPVPAPLSCPIPSCGGNSTQVVTQQATYSPTGIQLTCDIIDCVALPGTNTIGPVPGSVTLAPPTTPGAPGGSPAGGPAGGSGTSSTGSTGSPGPSGSPTGGSSAAGGNAGGSSGSSTPGSSTPSGGGSGTTGGSAPGSGSLPSPGGTPINTPQQAPAGDIYDGTWQSLQHGSRGPISVGVAYGFQTVDFTINGSGGLFVPSLQIAGQAQISGTSVSVPTSNPQGTLTGSTNATQTSFTLVGDYPILPFDFVVQAELKNNKDDLVGNIFTFPKGLPPVLTETECTNIRNAGGTCDQNTFSTARSSSAPSTPQGQGSTGGPSGGTSGAGAGSASGPGASGSSSGGVSGGGSQGGSGSTAGTGNPSQAGGGSQIASTGGSSSSGGSGQSASPGAGSSSQGGSSQSGSTGGGSSSTQGSGASGSSNSSGGSASQGGSSQSGSTGGGSSSTQGSVASGSSNSSGGSASQGGNSQSGSTGGGSSNTPGGGSGQSASTGAGSSSQGGGSQTTGTSDEGRRAAAPSSQSDEDDETSGEGSTEQSPSETSEGTEAGSTTGGATPSGQDSSSSADDSQDDARNQRGRETVAPGDIAGGGTASGGGGDGKSSVNCFSENCNQAQRKAFLTVLDQVGLDVELLERYFTKEEIERVEFILVLLEAGVSPERLADPMDREMAMVVMMTNLLVQGRIQISQIEAILSSPFPDVQLDFAGKMIGLANAIGLVDGFPDGTYGSGKLPTVAQGFKMVVNTLAEVSASTKVLLEQKERDNAGSLDWFLPYVQTASELGSPVSLDYDTLGKKMDIFFLLSILQQMSEQAGIQNPLSTLQGGSLNFSFGNRLR